MSFDFNNKLYNNVYIIENRNQWHSVFEIYNCNTDLVLCFDFGLKKELEDSKCQVEYLDHLESCEILNKYNLQLQEFLNNWYKKNKKESILFYKDIEFGNAMLLDIISDITIFSRLFFNIIKLKSCRYQNLYVSKESKIIIQVLDFINIKHCKLNLQISTTKTNYVFPINEWLNSTINGNQLIKILKNIYAYFQFHFNILLNSIFYGNIKSIYVQNYHPTTPIIKVLLSKKKYNLILNDFNFNFGFLSLFKQNKIYNFFKIRNKNDEKIIIENFSKSITYTWIHDQYDLGSELYKIIQKKLKTELPHYLSTIKNVKWFFSKMPISLAIPVTNLWFENRIIMNYCKTYNIPIFFIANGLLNNPLLNEGKDSNYVNCYSQVCKEDYFNNSNNVFSLGDPRMDFYSELSAKYIDRTTPIIIIGAAGYDPTDLNSYFSFEFDFLYDILKTISNLNEIGYKNKLLLKVRANGYNKLYENFCFEYFPKLEIEIIQNTPFSTIIKKADLYISFYSQTIFEASSLGIPVIYFKKDTQEIFRPFNFNGDLVTAKNSEDLFSKISLFYENHHTFNKIIDRKLLEFYIGPLDGNNCKRNINFIEKILNN
jgi:hypothetical protein